MNSFWTYTLELAGIIADLYNNNPKYNNVRVFLPNYGRNYADSYQERLLANLKDINPKKCDTNFY